MLISVIIPFYNGQDKITRCLDSIYSQLMPQDDFEVIIVDDVSPNNEGEILIKQYSETHPNLRYHRHAVNTRQGGARNTGVKLAKGDFIAFIDQDDTFRAGSWQQVYVAIKHDDLDILMVTAENITANGCSSFGYEQKNSSEVLSGQEFITRQEIPWVPWCYIYRREFLLEHNLTFTENTRFEDVDFVIKATVLAQRMKFLPITFVQHWISEEQTSTVANNANLIQDLIYLSNRIGELTKMPCISSEAAKVIKHQYCFHYNMIVTRFLWRLKYSQIISLLQKYPAICKGSRKMNLSQHNKTYASLAVIARPLLMLAWKIKRKLN